MRRADFLSLTWLDEGRPLVEPPAPSPVVADPSFLFPEETPDGRWALAAHDAFGIRIYRSEDGLAWDRGRYACLNRMRPFLRRIGTEYYLYAEAYRPFALPLQLLPRRPRWRSRIVLSRSPDLRHFGPPETLLEPEAAWARSEPWGASVSNPCLVLAEPRGAGAEGGASRGRASGAGAPEARGAGRAAATARLYFSAGLAHVPDCGFEEPRVIALAEGPGPRGPFAAPSEPILSPERDPLPGVLGAGSMKVLPFEDGWLALQNKIYAGPDGRSRSALFLLESEDGREFRPAAARGRPGAGATAGPPERPFLGPDRGWRSSHVYACDCRFREADGRWYLYYNARDGWYKTEGKERIGRLVSAP